MIQVEKNTNLHKAVVSKEAYRISTIIESTLLLSDVSKQTYYFYLMEVNVMNASVNLINNKEIQYDEITAGCHYECM